MSFSSVNLLWQKRFRGLMPVAQHAVADNGCTLLIRPDEMERRTYQVLSLDPDGNGTELSAISVERVYRFDAVADGRLVLGMTGDDVYVFRDGKKARFMAERRVTYADTALAPEPGWFVCGFSDALFNAHGIAFGDANGRLGWHKDMEIAVERVSITHDGRAIAVGLQDGRVVVLDNMRNSLWTCAQEEGIAALAMPGSGRSVVAGTTAGTVLSLDEDGGFRWRSSVGLPVIAAAVDRENRWVASLHSDGTTHLLVCFGPDGSPIWEYDLDSKPTGVSLSPDARHLTLSTASGTASGFEVDFAATPSYTVGGRKERELAAATTAANDGDQRRAHEILLSLVEAAPWDAEIARRRLAARDALMEALELEIETLAGEGQWSEAFGVLEEAAAVDRFNAPLFALRGTLRERAVAGLEERAATFEATYDYEGAARLHAQILTWDPEREGARESLNRIRRAQARELMEQGDEREKDGDLPGALALWNQAQQLDPNDELGARVGKAELERCLATGIAHYEAGRVAEAMFQFRKALALDPENETAERYLGYTEGQTGDTAIADRFARLE